MAYITRRDLEDYLGRQVVAQFADDAGSGVADEEVVGSVLADADEVVNMHLRGRYSVPLNPVPPAVKAIAKWVAGFLLYSRRPQTDDVPLQYKTNYDRGLRMLEGIRRGENLVGAPEETSSESADFRTDKTREDREFDLEGF